MGKLRVFAQNFTFYTIFFTFHRHHINSDIRCDPTRCNMCIVVHWYDQKYTTGKSYIVNIGGSKAPRKDFETNFIEIF